LIHPYRARPAPWLLNEDPANRRRTCARHRPAGEPCLIVIFGASGDLTKRLLMPAFYNLTCDGLLPEQFAIVASLLTSFDRRLPRAHDGRHQEVSTRQTFDESSWQHLVSRLYYTPGNFGDPEAYRRLAELVAKLDAQYHANGNIIFYMATPPSVFGLISATSAMRASRSAKKVGRASSSKSPSDATFLRPSN